MEKKNPFWKLKMGLQVVMDICLVVEWGTAHNLNTFLCLKYGEGCPPVECQVN